MALYITNGHEWIFILMKLNEGYDGASYDNSPVVKLRIIESDDQTAFVAPWPNLIAAILAHWVCLIRSIRFDKRLLMVGC